MNISGWMRALRARLAGLDPAVVGLTPAVRARLRPYAMLMRWDRPVGFYLLLWPTLWALWVAGDGRPKVSLLLIFTAGVFLMRSAGCVINDFVDRKIDPYVRRTQGRPLAAGLIAPWKALLLFVLLCALAFALVLLTNRLTVWLSLGGVILAATYPLMKRYTYLPQFYLGATFGWAVPMAFAAQAGTIPKAGWLLYIATLLWVTAYDTMYAMVDREDDLRIGVKSTAILFGDADRIMIGVIQAGFLWVMLFVGDKADLGVVYRAGLVAALVSILYQQHLIRNRDESGCFKAFVNNNVLGAVVFCGIVLDYWWR